MSNVDTRIAPITNSAAARTIRRVSGVLTATRTLRRGRQVAIGGFLRPRQYGDLPAERGGGARRGRTDVPATNHNHLRHHRPSYPLQEDTTSTMDVLKRLYPLQDRLDTRDLPARCSQWKPPVLLHELEAVRGYRARRERGQQNRVALGMEQRTDRLSRTQPGQVGGVAVPVSQHQRCSPDIVRIGELHALCG